MTAFLYIPSNDGLARRVDFDNIASLFSEAEEPARTGRARRLVRFLAALVLVLVTLGDLVLVTRGDVLASSQGLHTLAAPGHSVSL